MSGLYHTLASRIFRGNSWIFDQNRDQRDSKQGQDSGKRELHGVLFNIRSTRHYRRHRGSVQCSKNRFRQRFADPGHAGKFFDPCLSDPLDSTEMIQQRTASAGTDSGYFFKTRAR